MRKYGITYFVPGLETAMKLLRRSKGGALSLAGCGRIRNTTPFYKELCLTQRYP